MAEIAPLPANAATSSKPARWRRRRFIVDSRLQFGLVAVVWLQLGLFAIVLSICLFGPAFAEIRRPEVVGPLAGRVADRILYLDARFWPAVGLAFILSTLVMIRVSHRIAGPLVRMRRVMKSIASGDVPAPITLRHDDYLKREAKTLNEMLAALARDEGLMEDVRVLVLTARERLAGEPDASAALEAIDAAVTMLETPRRQPS